MWIVIAQIHVLVAVAHIGAVTADIRRHRQPVIGLAEFAGQFEQFQRLLEGDPVHFLARSEAGERRFLLILPGTDLHEGTVAPHAHGNVAAILGMGAQGPGLRGLRAADRRFGVLNALLKRLPEVLQQWHPLALAPRNGVKGILHSSGEFVIHVLGEVVREETIDDRAHIGGHESTGLHLDVLAIAQGGDDGGVGGGPADSVLFQRPDQRRLRIARGRLGEMLLAEQFSEFQPVANLQGRQDAVVPAERRPASSGLVSRVAVRALLVDDHEAGFDQHGPGSAKRVTRLVGSSSRQVKADRIEEGGTHLRRYRAFPDQVVQSPLLKRQRGREFLRHAGGRGRPYRLVGFLGVLGPGAVAPRTLWQVFGPVTLLNE